MDGVAEQGREAVTTVGGWLVRLLPEGLQTPLMAKIASSSIGLLLLGLLVWAARRVVTRYVRDTELRYRARKVVVSLGMVLGAIYVAGVFSDSLRNVTIALGVAGAALALALREVLASVAAWVAIAFGGFFRVGDRIAAGGVMGDVMDIGLTRTTLMECGEWVNADQYNGRIVRIPNAALLSQPIANYSQDFPFVWDELLLPILYGSDLRLAQALSTPGGRARVGRGSYAGMRSTTPSSIPWSAFARARRGGPSSPSATWWTTSCDAPPRPASS